MGGSILGGLVLPLHRTTVNDYLERADSFWDRVRAQVFAALIQLPYRGLLWP